MVGRELGTFRRNRASRGPILLRLNGSVFLESKWCGVMSENQRQFSRCSFSGADSVAVLVVNGRSIPGKLVEMSIGGFCLFTHQTIRVGSNDSVRLKARGLDYIVRVTYQKPNDGGVFVGLKQVEEILPDNTVPPESVPWLSTAAWAAALSTVAAAMYCLSGIHESLPK